MTLYQFAPSLILLLTLSFLPQQIKIPRISYAIGAIVLFGINLTVNGVLAASASALAAVVLFILCVFLGGLSARTTFGWPVAAIGIPVLLWFLFIPGLAAAAAYSAYRLRRTGGAGYVSAVTGETFAAIGLLTPTHGFPIAKPDLSRLPLLDKAEKESESMTPIAKAHREKVPLLWFLTIGLGATGMIAMFLPV